MDNITHSLFGYATAKIFNAKVNPKQDPKVSWFLSFVAIFAANCPDLDLIMSLIEPGPIGYMLHHRGHTHTLLFVLPQAVLLFLFSVWAFKIKDTKIRCAGLGLIILNLCLHFLMDYQNSYGIHPFAPWNNKWFYNDNLFIIEPLLWFVLLPIWGNQILVSKVKITTETTSMSLSKLKWWGIFAFFSIVNLLAVVFGFITWPSFVICLGFFFSLSVLFKKRSVFAQACVSLICIVVIINGFAVLRNTAIRAIQGELGRQHVDRIFDISLHPMPANPFCWKFLAVTTSSDIESYTIHAGAYRLPILNWLSCPDKTYAKSVALGRQKHQQERVIVEYSVVGQYQHLVEDLGSQDLNCKRDQWLQFVRVPYRPEKNIYVDMRFFREQDVASEEPSQMGLNFINLLDPKVRCVRIAVPWIPPRQDMIDRFKSSAD